MNILDNYRDILPFGESRAKSYRYSKAPQNRSLFRPVTLSLCLPFGAERRLESNRYSLLRLLDILNQCIHCAWLAFRYHFRICTPHSLRIYDYVLPSWFTDNVKGVADNVLSRPIPHLQNTIIKHKLQYNKTWKHKQKNL